MSTKPAAGEVVEPYANPELLAPGTVQRPPHITPADWARMPWPAQWRAARREPARQARAALHRATRARADSHAARRRLALLLDEPVDQAVVIPTDPPDVTARRRAQLQAIS